MLRFDHGFGLAGVRRPLRVGYDTSGGTSPFGQSNTLPGKSGRGRLTRKAATSKACWSVSVTARSKGMLSRMNAATTLSRPNAAPMLKERGPQTGGASGVPRPLGP